MDGISNNFEEAVQKVSSVLAVTGKVVPVTLENIVLKAKLENNMIVEGESNIPEKSLQHNSKIQNVFIEPENAKALSEAVTAIKEADAIILGPGSLYTSVIPNLLINDIKEALKKTKAPKIYISNIMTQPGETDNFTVSDHIKTINKHCHGKMVDYVIVNVGQIDKELEEKYKKKKSKLVKIDEEKIRELNVDVIGGNFLKVKNELIRHNSEKLASILIETIMEKKLLYDKKKIIEYFYLSERLKENKNKQR